MDCRQAREYAASLGGPHSKGALSKLSYFANDLSLASSDDFSGMVDTGLLRLTQLRSEFLSTRLVTNCCQSTLAVDHPNYGGRVVMVPTDSCVLHVRSELPPLLARIYMNDWDEATDGPPPPVVPSALPVVRADEPDYNEKAEVYREHFRNAKVELPRQGRSLQELFAQLAPAENLGLTRGERFHQE